MKPKKIFLVRHGQSEGNVDNAIYDKKPDYQLELTTKGKIQALEAGKTLRDIIKNERVKFYVSPLWRTRSTFKEIYSHWRFETDLIEWQEEPRLREQEWGHLRSLKESTRVNKERDDYGAFYYRVPDGESGADVYDRVASFFGSLHRDFEKETFLFILL